MSYKKNVFNYLNYALTGTEHGGPFNAVAPNKPSGYLDSVYWQHDKDYGKLGPKAYFTFNYADQDLLDRTKGVSGAGLARGYFNLKRKIAGTYPARKRLRGSNTESSLSYPSTSISTDKSNMPCNNYPIARKYSRGMRRGGKSHRYVKRPISKLLRSLMPIVEWNMFGGNHTIFSSAGQQSAAETDFRALFVRADLKKIYQKMFVDFYRQLPTGVAGGQKTNDAATMYPDLVCKGWKRNYKLMNTGTSKAYLEFWEFNVRKVTADRVTTSLTEEMLKLVGPGEGNYGLGAFPQNTEDPTTDETFSLSQPGKRFPAHAKEFWKTFGLRKKTKIVLEPGATATFTQFVPGFYLTRKRLYEDDYVAEYIPHLTIPLVWFQIGERVYDNAVGNQALSYAPTSVSYNITDYTKWLIMPRLYDRFFIKTNYPTDFTTAYSDSATYPVAGDPARINQNPPTEYTSGTNMET